jgi:hypothetical protein
MNWRKRKKLWKRKNLWHTPGGGYNGSNRSMHTMAVVAYVTHDRNWTKLVKTRKTDQW